MVIWMLIGPSYRYIFTAAPISLDVAIGTSLAGQDFGEGLLELGIGGIHRSCILSQ